MKTILLSLLLSTSAFAQSVFCSIQEMQGAKNHEQTLEVAINNDDPHGSMQNFTLSFYSQYKGFVAVVKEMAVIHLYAADGSTTYTAHGNIIKGQYASLQILFPHQVDDLEISGILIQCGIPQGE